MKTTIIFGKLFLAAAVAIGTIQGARAEENSVDQQIRTSNIFRTQLEMFGPAAPSGDESKALLGALRQFNTDIKSGLTASEAFLRQYPKSPWASSLRVNLAEYYRESGRYSLALEHWEKAWLATKQSSNVASQKLAVRAFAGWTHLLASIGEKEKLNTLFAELDSVHLPLGSYSTVIEETQEGFITMSARPEISFRCGSYALGNIAMALHLSSSTSSNLFATDSPATGFTMDQLLRLAETNGISLEAVQRPPGAKIIVPSVVHWKLDHYAAIVDEQNGRYKVIDPTFRGHVWMDADTIDSECSGAFLVLKTNAPMQWAKLSLAECSSIRGKGVPNEIEDFNDNGPDCPDPSKDDDSDDLPSSNDGPADGSLNNPSLCDLADIGGPEIAGPDSDDPDDNDPTVGMPRWTVSEPYTTLWLTDTPLLYRKSNGKWATLQLRYKHRGEDKGSNIGSFGPNWECNYIGFLQENTNTPDAFTDHSFGGGIKKYNTNGTPNYKSMKILSGVGTSTVQTTSATGAETTYGSPASGGIGIANHFPTQRVDRYGKAAALNYSISGSLVKLSSSVDRDGRSLTFAYTNTASPNLITSVTDPYNRSAYFTYNAGGLLATITDMAGMVTTFQYDSGNRITSMTTAYGTTSFEYFSGMSTNYSPNLTGTNEPTLRRALRITEASGDKQLYAYCDMGPTNDNIGYFKYARNSYHWNRAQYAAISSIGTNYVLDMPVADYAVAPTKHWLHGDDNVDGHTISDTISSESKPKDSSGNRATSFYGYTGAAIGSVSIGTQKRITEYQTGSGASTISFQRNYFGQPTNMMFYKAGYAANYTNNYSTNTYDLQTVFGPRGERIRGYGYHSSVPHLLVAVTNAMNEVIRYTHDTSAMKLTSVTLPSGLVRSNIYYSSGTSQGFPATRMVLGIRTNFYGYSNGNLVAKTNELGLVKTYIYDGLNRLVSTAFPDGTTISNIYNKLDVVATKDRLNQWTYLGYNSVRQLMAVTNAAGEVTTYDYCSCGSPDQVTRWNGSTPVITYYNHDISGNLTNITFPDGYQLNYVYNPDDTVDTITDKGGYHLNLLHTQLGTSPKIYQAKLNGQVLFNRIFDEYGRIVQTLDRDNVVVTNDYDFLDRVVARRTVGGSGYGPEMTGLESFTYNTNGLVSYTDVLGKITRYLRDSAGRVLNETNANSEVLAYAYNPAGQLLTLTDGKGQITHWNYDEYGRVTNKVDAATNVLFVYKYDPLDRITNRWSTAKSNTVYSYDPVGNLTNVVYASGNTTNISFRYDGLNRLTNMMDAAGSTVFGWSDGDQLAREDGPWANDTVSYGYTNRLRSVLTLSQPNASDWTQGYGYDNMMRLHQLISPAGEFDYNYSGTSEKPDSIYYPNSISIYNSFDGMRRLTESIFYAASVTLDRHQYSYNEGNQRTQQVFIADINNQDNYVNYTYDNIGQLKTAKGFDHKGDPATGTFSEVARVHEQFGYGYDAARNLQYRTNNALVQTFNVDSRNELTTATRTGTLTVAGTATEPFGDYGSGVTNVTVSGTGLSSGTANLYFDGSWARAGATPVDGNNSYTATARDTYNRTSTDSVTVNLPATNQFVYDLNGNLRTNNTRIFDYDDENQLIRVTEPNTWKTEFTYDGMLRMRIRREFAWTGSWTQTNEMRYLCDGHLVIQERDANNLPFVTYTRGNDLNCTLQGAGGIGGLLARTDSRQTLGEIPTATAYYFSDANGNITSLAYASGRAAARYSYDPFGSMLIMSGPLAAVNKYRFSSKEVSDITGLYGFGFRFYDANLQRWLSRDPLGDIGSLVVATADFAPWNDHDNEESETEARGEILQAFVKVNRNVQTFAGNAGPNNFDAFGLCDGEANEGNVEAVNEALEAAEGDTQKTFQRAVRKKLQDSKIFGNGPEGAKATDVNKLKQLLNPNELQAARQDAMTGVRKAIEALKNPKLKDPSGFIRQLETQLDRAKACTMALGK